MELAALSIRTSITSGKQSRLTSSKKVRYVFYVQQENWEQWKVVGNFERLVENREGEGWELQFEEGRNLYTPTPPEIKEEKEKKESKKEKESTKKESKKDVKKKDKKVSVRTK